jgi:hypothetical protein
MLDHRRDGRGRVDRDTINVADLKLDVVNPRHDPARGQREAIAALLNQDGSKMLRLAEDIATYGLSPIDDLLVLEEPGPSYTVIEGNRRLACIKLLGNPDLAKPVPRYIPKFRAIAKKAVVPLPYELEVAIIRDREDAKHWQVLRHRGQSEGAGTVPWDSEASTRFFARRGTHTEKAIAVLDAVEAAFPGNAKLLNDVRQVRRGKPSTFGRLVGDPFVRERLGIQLKPTVGAQYKSEQIEPVLSQILSDMNSGKISVSDLKTKEQRRKYILVGLKPVLPDEADQETVARPLVPPGTPRPPAAPPKPTPALPPKAGPTPMFDGVRLTNLGGRIATVLSELQRLDVEKYPNAAAALLRVVIELAVTEVHSKKGWPMGPKVYLKDMVRKCVNELDPSQKDLRYQPVRAGLNNPNSLVAVATMHAYLHNAHYHPIASELRSTSANYAPFLAGLDAFV